MRRTALVVLTLGSGWVLAGGQKISINGPDSGFVFDRAAAAVRPIVGMPGAATLGSPIEVGFPLSAAAVSPRQDAILGVNGRDGRVFVIRITSGSAMADPLAGAGAAPDRMLFSPGGSTAALYFAASARVEVVLGFPDAPAVAWEIDVSALGGPPTALALSDDGRAVLAAATRAGAAPVYLFERTTACSNCEVDRPGGKVRVVPDAQKQRLVYSARHVPALAFAPGGRDALIADDADQAVYLLRNVAVRMLAPADGPVAVAFSGDGSQALVAGAGGTLTGIDLAGAAPPVTQQCGCAPGRLERMGGMLFRLNDVSDGPLWVWEAGGAVSRVSFVPARAGAQ